MELERTPNPAVLASARAFYAASKVLDDKEAANVVIPKIVNAAFALELYLKSFNSKIIFENSKELFDGRTVYKTVINKAHATGHTPSALYRKIKPDVIEKIERQYFDEIESFEVALVEFDNVFIDWRYIFEGSSSPVNFTKLLRILDVMENVAVMYEEESLQK